MTKVYLVVLNLNGVEDTRECLKSLGIYEPGVSIIVVDNGSTDEEVKILKNEFPELPLIANETNLGFAAGNNQGISYALKNEAKYIGLLNNDTLITEPFIRTLINFLEIHKNCGAVSPVIYSWPEKNKLWGAGGRVRRLIARPEQLSETISKNPYKVDFLSGCMMLFKAEIFKKVGLLDEDLFFYYEDVDISVRLIKRGYSLWVVPQSRIFHKAAKTTGGQFSPFSTYHLLRSNLLFIEKHYQGVRKLLPFCYVFALSLLSIINLWRYRLPKKAEVIKSVVSAWRTFFYR